MTRAMVESWLTLRLPARPAALAEAMSRSLDSFPAVSLAAAPTLADALGSLGVHTLGAVNEERMPSDELALDLLAADAFVTYAFEAAAEEGVSVSGLANRLLREAA